jgi:hypothetical protein
MIFFIPSLGISDDAIIVSISSDLSAAPASLLQLSPENTFSYTSQIKGNKNSTVFIIWSPDSELPTSQ